MKALRILLIVLFLVTGGAVAAGFGWLRAQQARAEPLPAGHPRAPAREAPEVPPEVGPQEVGQAQGEILGEAPREAEPEAAEARPSASRRSRYPRDRTQSPLTPEVVAHLRAIVASNDALEDNVFARIGASATHNRHFMRCFAGPFVDLGGRESLRETIDFFLQGDGGWTNPFTRRGPAAVVGWSAQNVMQGHPSPLDQELLAIKPRFAVIMYGTNDLENRKPREYAREILRLVDHLIARGTIPLLTTVMPRDDDPERDAEVPLYNDILRAIAEGRQIPLIDFHRELLPLRHHGLAGDGIHPNLYRPDDQPRGCVLTEEGLQHGYNVRNLITLEALDRVRRAVLAGGPAPEPAPLAFLEGRGDAASPWVAAHLPFTDLAGTDAEHLERVYALHIEETTALRALISPKPGSELGLSLRSAAGELLSEGGTRVRASLEPGDYRLTVRALTAEGESEARHGEYVLMIGDDLRFFHED